MKRRLPDARRFMLLMGSSLALAFGQGHWTSGPLLLAGIIGMTMFFRRTHATTAAVLFVLAHVGVWELAYRGMVPLPTGARLGMETGTSVLLALVFLFDRYVSRREPRLRSTLALPCAWVAFDLASARLSPGGTWGSIAYTFADDLLIAQTASLVGWTGITFIATWVAAVVVWFIDASHANRSWRFGVTVTVATLIVVLGYGGWRTMPVTDGIRTPIACIVAPSTFNDETINDVWAYTRGVEASDESTNRAVQRIGESMEEHFTMVRQALDGGAVVVAWAEANATMTAAEYPMWIARAKEMALAHDAYIGMGVSVYRPRTKQPSLNQFVLIGPDGTIRFEFIKATRPPGAGHVKGDGNLPVIETPIGRMSSAICFDLDFPHIIRQVGRADVDLFLAPSNDWPEVRETHARMARLRAIEQGCAMVRPTKDGVSLMTDSVGRTVAWLTLGDGRPGVLAADVPIQSRFTLYSVIGDTFAWICCLAIPCLFIRIRMGYSPHDRTTSD